MYSVKCPFARSEVLVIALLLQVVCFTNFSSNRARSVSKVFNAAMPDCYFQTGNSSSRPLNFVLLYSSRNAKTSPFPSWSALYIRVLTQAPFGRLCDHNIDPEPSSTSLLTCITGVEILELHSTGWVRHNLHALPFEDVLKIYFGHRTRGASLCAGQRPFVARDLGFRLYFIATSRASVWWPIGHPSGAPWISTSAESVDLGVVAFQTPGHHVQAFITTNC